MSGFSDPVQSGVSGTSTIDDDLDPSVLIESTDGADYLKISTVDGAEGVTVEIPGPGSQDSNTGFTVHAPTGNLFRASRQGASGSGNVIFMDSGTNNIQVTGSKLFLQTNNYAELNLNSADDYFKITDDGDAEIFRVTQTGLISTGGETSALSAAGGLHLKIADSGLAAPNGSFDDLVIEHSGATGLTFSSPANSGIRFQKDGNTDHHGITFDSGTSSIRTRLGSTDRFYIDDAGRCKFIHAGVQYHAGTGDDDAVTEPLYLTGSGANLIIDCRKGNYGDVTLTADVTAVKFIYHPDDGSVFTMTAKIKQGSSVYEIDYSDSAVTVYAGDGTGSASTGEMKWSGGVSHTIGAVNTIDIVQFTIFPNGSTFDVFAAVIGQDFS